MGLSIRRNHSPFCESTGPIVREGFVATRIRALQELEAKALLGNRSHSPMVPCPPKNGRIDETQRQYRPDTAVKPTVNVDASGCDFVKNTCEAVVLEDYEGRIGAMQSHGKRSVAASPSSNTSSHKRPIHTLQPEELLTASLELTSKGDILVDLKPSSDNLEQDEPQLQFARHTSTVHNPVRRFLERRDTETAMPDVHTLRNSVAPKHDAPLPSSPEGLMTREHHGILGPRPISVTLADASSISNSLRTEKLHGEKYGLKGRYTLPEKYLRQSVADQLGDLVESSWVEGDIESNIDTKQYACQNVATPICLADNKTDHRSPSSFDKSPPPDPSSGTASFTESENAARSKSGGHSEDHFSQHDKQIYMPPLHQEAILERQMARHMSHRGPMPPSFERSSSEGECSYFKNYTSSPAETRRAWSMRYPNHLRRSNSEVIELDHITKIETAVNQSREEDKDSKRRSTSDCVNLKAGNGHAVPEEDRPALASKPSRSGFAGLPSNRPSSRPSSRVKKYWPTHFLGDGQPMPEDSKEGKVTSTSNSQGADNIQQESRISPTELAEAVCTVPVSREGSYDGRANELNIVKRTGSMLKDYRSREEHDVPLPHSTDPLLTETEQQRGERKQTPSKSFPTSPRHNIGSGAILQSPEHWSPTDAKSVSGRSQTSSSAKAIEVPTRRSSKRAPTSPSKSASLVSATSSNTLSYQREQSSSKPQRSHFYSPRSNSPISINVRGTRVPSHEPSDSTKAERRRVPSADSLQQHSSKGLAQRRLRGSGREIKKIQVIITFDGADDLVIEAVAGDTVQRH